MLLVEIYLVHRWLPDRRRWSDILDRHGPALASTRLRRVLPMNPWSELLLDELAVEDGEVLGVDLKESHINSCGFLVCRILKNLDVIPMMERISSIIFHSRMPQ